MPSRLLEAFPKFCSGTILTQLLLPGSYFRLRNLNEYLRNIHRKVSSTSQNLIQSLRRKREPDPSWTCPAQCSWPAAGCPGGSWTRTETPPASPALPAGSAPSLSSPGKDLRATLGLLLFFLPSPPAPEQTVTEATPRPRERQQERRVTPLILPQDTELQDNQASRKEGKEKHRPRTEQIWVPRPLLTLTAKDTNTLSLHHSDPPTPSHLAAHIPWNPATLRAVSCLWQEQRSNSRIALS